MTLPSSWSWPTTEQFLKDPLSYLDVMYRALSDELYAPSWRLQGTGVVAAGLTTITILAPIDRLPYTVNVTPDWLTTVRVTSKTTSGFIVDFGTAAPGGGGSVEWLAIQIEPGPG